VSSADSEDFLADKTDPLANLTIARNQNYCFVHVSDAPTDVIVNHSTEPQALFFQNSDTSQDLSGDGSFSVVSPTYTRITWVSGMTALSRSFQVRIRSPGTRLPLRRGWCRADAGAFQGDLQIIDDGEYGGGEHPRNAYFDAQLDWYERADDPMVVNLIVVGTTALFALLVLGVLCLCCFNLRRKGCTKRGEDEAQIEMLQDGDIAGVEGRSGSAR
jgi:hypothetical protein